MDTTKTNFLTMPLSRENREKARSFSLQQDTVEKGEKVYLNTLAILGVRSFLHWLGIETDLNAGDSWHPVVRCFRDVADLVIPDLGKLECRPVLPGKTVISLPLEVAEDRIAYVAVQFQEELNEVQLLGFVPALDPDDAPETIAIANLQPIENLIDYLERIEVAKDFLQSDEEVAARVRSRLNSQSFSEIAAQIERIYRTYDKDEWRYAGGDFLASCVLTERGVPWRGAAPAVDREEFNESQQFEFQNLAEELLEKLGEIWGTDDPEEQIATDSPTSEPNPITVQPNHQSLIIEPLVARREGLVNLSEWLQNPQSLFEDDFQTLESFLSNQEGNQIFRFASAPRSRSGETEETLVDVTGVKEIQLAEHLLAWIISCKRESELTRDILLRLYPTGNNTYLPAGVQLIVLDESAGDIFLEAQARSADNWIQLEFKGEPGERFSVKIALSDASVMRNFVI